MLFDTHSHLDQEEFDENRDQIIQQAREAGVTRLVAVGCTVQSSEKSVHLAEKYDGVFAAVGLQPNYLAELGPDDWSAIVELVNKPGVVAVGETGLDRHWDYSPFEVQQDYFDRHIRLAQQHDLPFVVHMRDCDDDIMQMLREARQRGLLKGIMHSFTGDAPMAAECVELGMHISFAGMVTFKKSTELRECVATIPADRLLVETDSPYLSPEPVRSKRPNQPANVRHTAACLAEVRGISLEELAATTTTNACKLFSLPLS
jgi:TatD DNase family protein